jgi:hypothetical protein
MAFTVALSLLNHKDGKKTGIESHVIEVAPIDHPPQNNIRQAVVSL